VRFVRTCSNATPLCIIYRINRFCCLYYLRVLCTLTSSVKEEDAAQPEGEELFQGLRIA